MKYKVGLGGRYAVTRQEHRKSLFAELRDTTPAKVSVGLRCANPTYDFMNTSLPAVGAGLARDNRVANANGRGHGPLLPHDDMQNFYRSGCSALKTSQTS